MQLLNIFANNILPVLLISGAAFTLGRVFKLDPKPLGKVIFYVLSPLLVFNLLTSNDLSLDRIAAMMGFTAVNSLIIGGLAFLAGKLFRLEKSSLIVVILTSMFMNAGNYGLPLVSFAFGEGALAYASVYFVTNTLLLNSVGVILASLGHLDLKKALLGILKVPAIYAILLALLFIQTGWTLPAPLQRTVALGAAGTIPAMLLLMGLELARVRWRQDLTLTAIPVLLRLVVGPLLGLGIAPVFRFTGPAYQAAVTENGMPSAVMATVLAGEYNLDSSLVTAAVFVSTILSPVTLTPLLYYLAR